MVLRRVRKGGPAVTDLPNLEDMIRAAAENGEITHLSVVPVAGKGVNNIGWAATYSPASKWANGRAVDVDPVQAIKLAMTDKALGPLNAKLHKRLAGKKPTKVVDDSEFI